MSNIFAAAIALAYVVAMCYHDGFPSALALCLPLSIVIALILRAETFADYTGWAGRVPIRRQSPATAIRYFGWALLLLPGAVLIWRQIVG